MLSYCDNEEGCQSARKRTKSGPAILDKGIIKKDVEDLKEVFALT